MTLAIEISCCAKLANDTDFSPFYREFVDYKQNSDRHAAPTRREQEEYASISVLFGRDRPNVDEEAPFPQRQETLSHLHSRQDDSEWNDEDGDLLAQWECTSDSYLIYSYFVYDGKRHYYIVDFIDNKAHANWENEEAKLMWIEEAKSYRLSIQQAAA